MKKIRIAARGSKLSRIQVRMVEEKLNKLGIETSFVEVKTKADLFQASPLSQLGKGVFEKEVNQAVINGEADIAVHSMKDMLSETPPGLELYAVLKRDPPFDVLISLSYRGLFELESGKVIGTSSMRRKNSIVFYRKDLLVRDLRGNIDTRLRKLFQGEYDAIIVAEASITRLAIYDHQYQGINYSKFDPTLLTPEANQGIIAIVGKSNSPLKDLLRELNDEKTYHEAIAERTALNIIGGGCHSPLGVLFEELDESEYRGIMTFIDGRKKITVEGIFRGKPEEVGEELGKRLLKEIKDEGIVIKT
jgi:hydroxymethylbilane synthase